MANLGANTPRPPNPPTTQRAHLHMRARACPRACACPGHCHTTPHPHKQAPHARKQHRHPQHILAIQAPQTTHDTTTHSACKPRCKHALRSPGPHEHCTQSTQRGAAGTKQRAAHASQRPRPTARSHLCTHHHTNEHHPTATPHTNTHTHTRALAAPLPQCVCWQRTQPTPANLSAHARTPNTQAHTYTDISACLPSQTPFICACQQVPAWHPLGPQAVRKHMRSLNAAQTGQHVGHALVHAGPLQREHAHTSHNLPAAHSPLHRAKHTQHRHTTCRTKQLAAFPLRTSQ